MGALAKITRQQVVIIGVVLMVIVAVGIGFGLIKPYQEKLNEQTQKRDTRQAVADQRPDAEKAKKQAQADVEKAQASWRRYESTLMPRIDITDLWSATQSLWHEQLEVLGPMTEKFLRADKSVQILQANVALPAPSEDPNQVNQPLFVFPLGQVTVQGTFENILRHVERWNRFNRLVLVDGLQLQGNSPQLVGSYTVTCYIFTQGETAGPAIPQAAGGGGRGGMGGMGMMMGGGMGGMMGGRRGGGAMAAGAP